MSCLYTAILSSFFDGTFNFPFIPLV